jgi:low temperature requirement protein LtrA
MKLRKDLIQAPIWDWEDDKEERHSNWIELLFDLIFVAAVSQLALNLNANYSFTAFVMLLPLFFAIWWGWLGHTIYLSRFGTDDVLHRFYTMAQMLVVASLAINVKNALSITGSGFALSYALLRFMLVAEYINAGKNITEARPLTNHYSIGFGLAAVLWLISAFIPAPWRFVLWGVAIIVDILTPLTAGKLNLIFPLHPTHLPERFGLFTIILIGEAIVSVVYVISQLSLNLSTGIIGTTGLVIAFCIWWGYFEESKGAEARAQAEGKDVGRYQLWLYSHFPLLLGIVGVAAGIRHVLSNHFWSPLASSEAWLLCISLAIALISLSGIFLSSFSWKECIGKPLVVFRIPYYLIILLVICTGFLGSIVPGSDILAILTLLCIFKVFLSLREPPDDIICEI